MLLLSLLGILILNIIGTSAAPLSFNGFPSIKQNQDDYRSRVPSDVIDFDARWALMRSNFLSSKLMPVIAKMESSNYVFSPFSSFQSLFVAAYGARASTEETLENSFLLKIHDVGLKYGLPALIESLNNCRGVELRIANSLFFSSKLHIRPEFIEIVTNRFLATVQKVDFEKINETNNMITEWGKNQTNNRIINSGNVTTDAVLCLMNTVTFKGTWLQKFDVLETKKRTFYVDGVTEKQVPTMSIEGFFLHGELSEIAATFVQLPFKGTNDGRNMSMIIILPKARDGVVNIENNFNDLTVHNLIEKGHVDKIYIELPKFKISSKINMKEVITRVPGLNRNSLFNPREANFTGISEDIPIFLNHFVQNSFIEIDEEGCEIVATTGYNQAEGTKDATPLTSGSTHSANSPSIIADHPFYALIIAQNKAYFAGGRPLEVFTVRFNG